jgi:hypothetical protein
MGDSKIIFISDKWSIEQLIDVQIRKSNERNRASIERLDALNRQYEEKIGTRDKTKGFESKNC